MNEWLKQVKDSWNKTADSAWYQSLRTDERITALVKEPANAFHPSVYKLINIVENIMVNFRKIDEENFTEIIEMKRPDHENYVAPVVYSLAQA